ncbi:transposase [Amphibacillus xylanus]|uniref:transposase n=1 Tax=Amphibacillus xylanus TaxID=1449 RepID=UPI0022B2303A|nr:transposase [Amphibacillus xylanus]
MHGDLTYDPTHCKNCGIKMKTSLKTLRIHLPYKQNSFIHIYNNGRIEGINNKIKVISKVAYGYRNFYYFKKRMMIHFKFKAIETNSSEKCKKKHGMKQPFNLEVKNSR